MFFDATEDEKEELRLLIKAELDRCDGSQFPKLCELNEVGNREDLTERILTCVLNNTITVGHAMMMIEGELNPNLVTLID